MVAREATEYTHEKKEEWCPEPAGQPLALVQAIQEAGWMTQEFLGVGRGPRPGGEGEGGRRCGYCRGAGRWPLASGATQVALWAEPS